MSRIALDAADIRILAAVQQNGQLSKSRLADIVNLSPTPCWTRLGKLKKAGLIKRYSAEIALDSIVSLSKVIVTVSLANHRKQNFECFEAHIRDEDDVVECIATGGGTDYVMKVVSRDLSSFQDMMEVMLSAELGIDRYMTYIVTREVKSASPNLSRLLPEPKG
ncbi:AsnC family transcriptional regulator [Kiloniella spongiae]|uniref:AsnC family transcriptional regulator n=1 Tax=Kiloniella spongiae TaxID=1489064 RepID=A0A0H2ME79_9PROT|nr:Lrp/AsnC family transcriptional regulator [Kiloniella spongiae]KLN60501.1 AsnC family transcriptional regulator [Kiloniella spongiae]